MDEKFKELFVEPQMTLRESLRHMDKAALQLLMVVDEQEKILGVVTDGDLRRAIINNVDFNNPISSVMNTNPVLLTQPVNRKKAFNIMRKRLIKQIPVINTERQVIDLILWNDFLEQGKENYPAKDIPVVIMAGGKGTRLDPFTKILPKPLIPVGDKPIIELIMDKFHGYGFNNFVISLNYKAEMIKMYFAENSSGYNLDYIMEKEFLGTAGALGLAKDKFDKTFILSNCDVVTDANFDDFLNYHLENKNHATVFAIVRHMKIPYGVMKMKDGDLDEILEKPEFSYVINTGIYALEPEIVDLITEGCVMNMPDLLILAKEKGLKVQVCPMSCTWFDVGEWDEYRKAVDFISGNRVG